MPPQPHIESAIRSHALPVATFRGALCLLATCWLTGCTTTQGSQSANAASQVAHAPVREVEAFDVDPMLDMVDMALLAQTTQVDVQEDPGPAAPDARDLVSAALKQLGVKYRYGGKAPHTGFDCSGLVVYAAEQSLGLTLPHHAATLARMGVSIKRAELQEGDLVFFNTRGKRFSHMGIYLGDNQFLHAPRTGTVVRIERMNAAYWKQRYNGARRLDLDTRVARARAAQDA